MEKDDRYIVPGLVRGLAALKEFSKENSELSVTEIAEAIDVNRSSSFRIMHTLEYCGFIQKVGNTSRYSLSSQVLDLGFRFLASLDVLEPSRPVLEKLRNKVTIASQLLIKENTDLVVVESFNATGPFTTTTGIGSRLPMHATMAGLLMLSGLTDDEIKSLYQNFIFAQFTEATVKDIDELLEAVSKVRGQHAVIAWGHYNPAMAACAAPIFSIDNKHIIAVVSVSCPIGSFSRNEFEGRIADATVEAAKELSSTLSLYMQHHQ